MRSLLFALTLAASALLPAAAGAAATTECLPSLDAARAAHPVEHLAWSGPANDRCYFKGHRGDRSTGKLSAAAPKKQAERKPATSPQPQPKAAPPATQPPPAAPVQVADLWPNEPMREAMESYVRDQYWVLMWRARN